MHNFNIGIENFNTKLHNLNIGCLCELSNTGFVIKLLNFSYSEYKISCLDIFGGHFVNVTLFWPKNSCNVQNGLDEKGYVL
jgi:hypothetical protein